MDWTVEVDMVGGLFCATLTGRRGGHAPFVRAGAETSDTGTEAVEPDSGSSWEGHSGVCVYRCLELKCGVLWGYPPIPSMAQRPRDSVAPLRRSSAGWMPARMRQNPITNLKAGIADSLYCISQSFRVCEDRARFNFSDVECFSISSSGRLYLNRDFIF